MKKKLSLILICAALICTSLPVSAEDFEKYEGVTEEGEAKAESEAGDKEEDKNPEQEEQSEIAGGSDLIPEENQEDGELLPQEEPENPSDISDNSGVADISDKALDDESREDDKKLEEKAVSEAKQYDFTSDSIEVRIKPGQTEFSYTGLEIKPEVEVLYHFTAEELQDTEVTKGEAEKLINPECYTVEYQDNIMAGEASIVIKGKDEDKKNEEPQDAKEETAAEDTYIGIKTVKFRITPADISNCSIKTPKTADYTGKQVKPAVKLAYQGKALIAGKDYKLAYSNNKKIGTASVKVSGIGNFTGSKTVKFKIKFGTPVVKVSSSYSQIKLKWQKVASAAGYVVYRSTSPKGKFKKIYTCKLGSKISYSDKKAKFGKTYYYKVRAYKKVKVKVKKKTKTKQEYGSWSSVVNAKKKLGAVTLKSAKCASENTAKLTWKKTAGAQGYEIYKSETQNGTYVYAGSVNGSGKVSGTVKKLKTGVAYYFKIRAFRKVGSKKNYGSFSAVKKETFSDGQKLYTLFPDGVPTTKAKMETYLVTITVPIKDVNGVPSTKQLRVHKDLAKNFMGAFQDMYAIGFPVRAEDTDTYNWRSMASGKNRSHHSYGCVVDLNWNSNPMIGVTDGKYAPGVDPYSVTPQVVAIWKKYGFYWGGNWKSSKDYMHFSYTNH